MSFVFYRQPDSMDCGPTCLKMVAKYYGRNLSLESIRAKSQAGKQGVNLQGLCNAAELFGFVSRPVKISYSSMANDAVLPAILHWRQCHFVVLYKAVKGKLTIADPARGIVRYSEEEFKTNWIIEGSEEKVGVALLLEPSSVFYGNTHHVLTDETGGSSMGTIISYLEPYRRLLAELLIVMGFSTVLQFILPFTAKSIVDTGISSGNINFVVLVLFAQLGLLAGRLAMEFIRNRILFHVSNRINISILSDFLFKVMKLPMWFFDNKSTGDILQRMHDHKRIETFLTGSSLNTLFACISLIFLSVVLAIFNVFIFTVFIAATFLYSLWVVLFLKKRKAIDNKRFEIASVEQSTTIQLIQGMQEIKLNGIENAMHGKWQLLQMKLYKLNITGLRLNQWQQSGAFFLNEGKNLFVTFLSAGAVIEGQMTLGSMLAIQYIVGQLNSPVEQMAGFLQNWQNAKLSLGRLNEIHSMENEEPHQNSLLQELPAAFTSNLTGGKADQVVLPLKYPIRKALSEKLPANAGGIVTSDAAIDFRNVSFTYPGAGNKFVLRDISLKIPKGTMTAIVGTSGSGKTTLLKLLLKYYEPQSGVIKLNGTPLSDISHKAWRKHCGTVTQESFIFSDTIARNIAIGTDEIDDRRIYDAIKVANLHEFINSLPLGIYTRVGAEGAGISVGQKQRILIARAVYRNPEFIFFDEATNTLDARNESIILKNLESFLINKTVVAVAHRLSTVRNADQIVVLDAGKVEEIGSHQELIRRKGKYYNLVKSQLELEH